MQFNIRPIQNSDYYQVQKTTRDAFWNLYMPGADEHLIIEQIRKSDDYIEDLSLVIEVDEEIVGSILYTKSKIVQHDGSEIPTVTFGPVSISPDYQGQGLGKELINYSINLTRDKGYRAIIISGYPYHYHPFGFNGTKAYNLAMLDGNFYTGVMALPLYEGTLDNLDGVLHFSDVFETSPEDVAEFDKNFPEKEKQVQESQEEFAKASVELDED